MGRIFVLFFFILFGLLNIFSIFIPINYPNKVIKKLLIDKNLRVDEQSFYFNPLLLSFSSDFLKIESKENTFSGKFENISFNPIFKTFSCKNCTLKLSINSDRYQNYQDIIKEIKNIIKDYNLDLFNFELNFQDKSFLFDKFSIYNSKNNINFEAISRIKTSKNDNSFKINLDYDLSKDNLNSFVAVSSLFEIKYFNKEKRNVFFKTDNILNLLQIDDFFNFITKDNEFNFNQSIQFDGEFTNDKDFFYGEVKLNNNKILNIKGIEQNNNKTFLFVKNEEDSSSKKQKDIFILENKNIYLSNEDVIAKDNNILYFFLSFFKSNIKFNLQGDFKDITIKNNDYSNAFKQISFDIDLENLDMNIKKLNINSSFLDINIINNKFDISDTKLILLPNNIKNNILLKKDNFLLFNLNGILNLKLNEILIQDCKASLDGQNYFLFDLQLNKEFKKINVKLSNFYLDNLLNLDNLLDSVDKSINITKQKLLMYYFDSNVYDISFDIENSKLNNFFIQNLSFRLENLLSSKTLNLTGRNDFFNGDFSLKISKDDNSKDFYINSNISLLNLTKIKKILNLDNFDYDRDINIPSFIGFDGNIDINIDNLIANRDDFNINLHELSIKSNINNGIFTGKIEDKDSIIMNISFDLQSTPKYEIGYSFSGIDISNLIQQKCQSLTSNVKNGILSFQGKIYSTGFNPLKIIQSAKGNGLAYVQNFGIKDFDLNFMARNLLYRRTNWKDYLINKSKLSYIPKINITYKLLNMTIDGNFIFEKDLISGNGSFKWNFNDLLFEDIKGMFIIGSKNKKKDNIYIYTPFATRIKCKDNMLNGIIDWKNLENFISNIK